LIWGIAAAAAVEKAVPAVVPRTLQRVTAS
jgi:proline iminopeptidase